MLELAVSIENLDHNTRLLPKAIESQYEKTGIPIMGNCSIKLYYRALDENGNIVGMTQNGLKLNASPVIDQLMYAYQPNTNKLSKVIDAANDNTSALGDFKYDPATKYL